MSSKLHSIILVGSSNPRDGWMLTDANKVAWAIADVDRQARLLAALPLTAYHGSSPEGTIIGDPECDRLLVPHAEYEIITNPKRLKARFLDDLDNLACKAGPNHTVLVVVCSHGRSEDGAILVGDTRELEGPKATYITITDMRAALKRKAKSVQVLLWLTTDSEWLTLAAARSDEESLSISESPSSQHRGGHHMFSTFVARGQQADVHQSHLTGTAAHSVAADNDATLREPPGLSLPQVAQDSTDIMLTFRFGSQPQHPRASLTQLPLPLPLFTHPSLARLRLVPHQAGQTPALDLSHSLAGTVPRSEMMKRISGLPLAPTVRERLYVLASAHTAYNLPNTWTVNLLSEWIRLLGTDSATPAVPTAVLLHALGYQEHLLLLADAMGFTHAWNRVVPVDAAVDLRDQLRARSAVSGRQLLRVLETSHTYSYDSSDFEQGQKSFNFDWNTPIMSQFLASWYRAGYPEIDLGEIDRARNAIRGWVHSLGQEEPQLLCPCGDHLLATQAEYEARRANSERKQGILKTLSVIDSPPQSPRALAGSFSWLDLWAIMHCEQTPTLPPSCTFP